MYINRYIDREREREKKREREERIGLACAIILLHNVAPKMCNSETFRLLWRRSPCWDPVCEERPRIGPPERKGLTSHRGRAAAPDVI